MENVQNSKVNRWIRVIPIGVVVCIAILFRFYSLNTIPPSPSLDEVSIGYNAFSILKTGADEYKHRFPLLLRAYDDWRPALYVYIVLPFVSLFGLTPLAVRLPSVILSTGTVILTYALFQLFFKRYVVSIIAIALLAISPWHVYISRLGHEVNLGLLLVLSGIYFFFISLVSRKSRKMLLFSAISFSLSFYAYQSQKIITPLTILCLLILYWNDLMKSKLYVIVSLLTGILVVTPLLLISINPAVSMRLQKTSVFSDHPLYISTDILLRQARQGGDIVAQLQYSRKITTLKIFIQNYLVHFSPQWLFWGGDNERHKVSGMGLLYPWEIPFIIIGLISLWRSTIDKRKKIFIVAWFFISPLPGALTTEAPHAMRTYSFLPLWQFFTAYGVYYIYTLFQRKIERTIFIGILCSIFVFSGYTLFIQYFSIFPVKQSGSFQYTLPLALAYTIEHENEYNTIIVSNQENLYQSYMYYLFYSKYDPRQYHFSGGTYSGGYDETHAIGKYEFRPIVWEKEQFDKGILFVGNIKDFPYNVGEKATYTLLNGQEAIKIISR